MDVLYLYIFPLLGRVCWCLRQQFALIQVFEATVNRGGGASGVAARLDAKCSYKCYICLCAQPSEKSLQIHFDAKHPKDTLDLEKAKVAA